MQSMALYDRREYWGPSNFLRLVTQLICSWLFKISVMETLLYCCIARNFLERRFVFAIFLLFVFSKFINFFLHLIFTSIRTSLQYFLQIWLGYVQNTFLLFILSFLSYLYQMYTQSFYFVLFSFIWFGLVWLPSWLEPLLLETHGKGIVLLRTS